MEDKIPAGTKVKVAGTMDGVATMLDAEVLSHGDGVVHVAINGEVVSVSPEQVVTGDVVAVSQSLKITPTGITDAELMADIDALSLRVKTLETIPSALSALQARVEKIEAWIVEEKMPAPTAQISTTDENSTALTETAAPTGEGQATSGPEATAGAAGQ